MSLQLKMSGGDILEFDGKCLASVVALNHDDSIRRCFKLYSCEDGYVAQKIDDPDTIDARYWGAECKTALDVYDFFGNEPLANYLYGRLQLQVPGLGILL